MNKFRLIKARYYGLTLNASIDPVKPFTPFSNFFSSYKWLLSRSYAKGSLILKVIPFFKNNSSSFIITEKYMFLRTLTKSNLVNLVNHFSIYRKLIIMLLSVSQTYLIFLLKIDSFFNKNIK
jgi:hypothetical protein